MEKFELKFEELEAIEEMITDDQLGDVFRVIGVIGTVAGFIGAFT
jgi:hypothetical protein